MILTGSKGKPKFEHHAGYPVPAWLDVCSKSVPITKVFLKSQKEIQKCYGGG